MTASAAASLRPLLDLCKRRGFLLPSYSLYNGLRGSLDYGPLGVELKRAVLHEWWRAVVYARDDVHAVDTPIITPREVLKASGHESTFSDPLVDCRLTHERFRADTASPLYVEQVRGADDAAVVGWRVPIFAPDKGKARAWEQLIRDRLAPGAQVTRDGRTIFVHLAEPPSVPGVCVVPAGTAQSQLAQLGAPALAKDSETSNMSASLHLAADPNYPSPVDTEKLQLACQGISESGSNSPFVTEPRAFNLMFRTHIGAGEVGDVAASPGEPTIGTAVYLRPETAQGIFANFPLLHRAAGQPSLPFGIAQHGKSFRNEIRTEKSAFRTCEFEQLELEYFVPPMEESAQIWLDRWRQLRLDWWRAYAVGNGQRSDGNIFRLRAHTDGELAHYARSCWDVEYRFPWGWGEVEGVADRGDHDLRQHAEAIRSSAGMELSYDTGVAGDKPKKALPWVVESSAGLNRACLVYLLDAYTETAGTDTSASRVLLRLHPRIAPIQVAIMPLMRQPEILATARQLLVQLRLADVRVTLDATSASIGRRYARQDEAGTPWCITVDFDTAKDGKVTLRERDTMTQVRVPVDAMAAHLRSRLEQCAFIPRLDEEL